MFPLHVLVFAVEVDHSRLPYAACHGTSLAGLFYAMVCRSALEHGWKPLLWSLLRLVYVVGLCTLCHKLLLPVKVLRLKCPVHKALTPKQPHFFDAVFQIVLPVLAWVRPGL